jgi:hypothetical protein
VDYGQVMFRQVLSWQEANVRIREQSNRALIFINNILYHADLIWGVFELRWRGRWRGNGDVGGRQA